MSVTFEDVQASYGRCLRDKKFISRFYELLLERDPAIRRMFENTDWGQQQRALRRGISIALTFAGGSRMVQRSMDEMASVHSRSGRCPVAPDHYRHWCEALMQAVGEHEQRLTPELQQHWQQALGMTTEHFSAKY
jgi:hemoglobin-like flavoprotein